MVSTRTRKHYQEAIKRIRKHYQNQEAIKRIRIRKHPEAPLTNNK